MEEISAFYLDSNFLINAVANDELLGIKARDIISLIENFKMIGLTSLFNNGRISMGIKKIWIY